MKGRVAAALGGKGGRLTAGVAVLGLAAGLSSCASSSDMVSASATFPDIEATTSGTPVEMADVIIGHVTSTTVQGGQARLGMTVKRSAQVPADVTAEVTQDSLLGQNIVQLVPNTKNRNAPLLANGATISKTQDVPGLEQLIKSGTDVFAGLSANQLATLIHEGAVGFGGQGPTLHRLLDDLNNVTNGYAGQTQTIQALVSNLDQFGSTVAPAAQSQVQAIANLAQTSHVLNDQANRFADLLSSLTNLSVQSLGILNTYMPQIDRQFSALRSVTQAVADRQSDLGNLLTYTYQHNVNVSGGIKNDFGQVLNDLIVCGFPGGGEQPNDPASSCHNVPGPPQS
ncbi:MAG TPA: MCE family protein [Acidimicrobiales bacterium]|jgi:phospholipid/cholesterol/gamma-HCH transport system substrate-binding protein|nr:MCE family protein [Acidimicrobiales bacterium]